MLGAGAERDLQPGDVVAGHRITHDAEDSPRGGRLRARNVRTGRDAAVIDLPVGVAADRTVLEELRALAACRHGNVLRIADISPCHDGSITVVTDWSDARPLHRIGAHGMRLPPLVAASVVVQAGAALVEARAHGLVRRPLVASGLVARWDQILLAPLPQQGPDDPFWRSRRDPWLGDPERLAPEAAAGAWADERADVHALGLLLHEQLTGAPRPVAGPGAARPATRSLHRAVLPLGRVADRATAEAPEARHPSLHAFMEDVVVAAGQVSERMAAAPPTGVRKVLAAAGSWTPARGSRGAFRRRVPVLVAAALVLGGSAVAVAAGLGGSSDAPRTPASELRFEPPAMPAVRTSSNASEVATTDAAASAERERTAAARREQRRAAAARERRAARLRRARARRAAAARWAPAPAPAPTPRMFDEPAPPTTDAAPFVPAPTQTRQQAPPPPPPPPAARQQAPPPPPPPPRPRPAPAPPSGTFDDGGSFDSGG